jgi:hypothetical protein
MSKKKVEFNVSCIILFTFMPRQMEYGLFLSLTESIIPWCEIFWYHLLSREVLVITNT